MVSLEYKKNCFLFSFARFGMFSFYTEENGGIFAFKRKKLSIWGMTILKLKKLSAFLVFGFKR